MRSVPFLLKTGSWAASWLRLVALLALSLVAAGCASVFRAETTVFHQWANHTSSPLAFRFAEPAPAERTLEREAWRQVLRQALQAKGFQEQQQAPQVLAFDYTGRETRRLADDGLHGTIWMGGVFRSGGVVLGGGVPLGVPPVREVVLTERTLSLVFTEDTPAGPVRRYEGRAVTIDGGRDAMAALPYLVRALLEDFPGPSGVTRSVRIPLAGH